MDTALFSTTSSGSLSVQENGKNTTYKIYISLDGKITVYDSDLSSGITVPVDTWKAIVKSIELLENATYTTHVVAI